MFKLITNFKKPIRLNFTNQLIRSTSTLKLNTGALIPQVALGTWQATDDEVYNAVLAALKSGYKHIDTAACYGNEEPVGKAIKDSGIPRSELFITTKLWATGAMNAEKSLNESLTKLGLDYVDLYLIHWPVVMNPNGNHPLFPLREDGSRDLIDSKTFNYLDTWASMQELVSTGKTKAVGVSNFTVPKLKKLLADSRNKIIPATNQVELHPYLPQQELVDFCQSKGIVVECYSPLGSSGAPLLENKTLLSIAEKYNVSPATICISWAIWRNCVVLPKSVSASRIENNIKVVKLEDTDGEAISKIHETDGIKRFVYPNWGVPIFEDDE